MIIFLRESGGGGGALKSLKKESNWFGAGMFKNIFGCFGN
jgi:hypothetical protein